MKLGLLRLLFTRRIVIAPRETTPPPSRRHYPHPPRTSTSSSIHDNNQTTPDDAKAETTGYPIAKRDSDGLSPRSPHFPAWPLPTKPSRLLARHPRHAPFIPKVKNNKKKINLWGRHRPLFVPLRPPVWHNNNPNPPSFFPIQRPAALEQNRDRYQGGYDSYGNLRTQTNWISLEEMERTGGWRPLVRVKPIPMMTPEPAELQRTQGLEMTPEPQLQRTQKTLLIIQDLDQSKNNNGGVEKHYGEWIPLPPPPPAQHYDIEIVENESEMVNPVVTPKPYATTTTERTRSTSSSYTSKLRYAVRTNESDWESWGDDLFANP